MKFVYKVLCFLVLTSTVYKCSAQVEAHFSSSFRLLCEHNCVQFTDESTGNINSWDWIFPHGNPESFHGQNPPLVCYDTAGNYDVLLHISDGTNSITLKSVDHIKVKKCSSEISADFIQDTLTICKDSCFFLLDESYGYVTNWEWTFEHGNPETYKGQDPFTVCYDTAGTFDIKLLVSDDYGHQSLREKKIIVEDCQTQNCSLAAFFGIYADPSNPHLWYLLNLTIGDPVTYSWDWGDGESSEGEAPTHSYSAEGYYDICLKVTDINNCVDSFCSYGFHLYRMEEAMSAVTVEVVTTLPNDVSPISSLDKPFLVYPNPCANCEVLGVENINDVLVTDVLGRNVKAMFYKSSSGYFINLPSYKSGIFFIRDLNSGRVAKFIKK